MLINTKQELIGSSGEVLKDGNNTITVGFVLNDLLLNRQPENPTPAKVMRYYNLGTDCKVKDEVELTDEDIKDIQTAIVKHYFPVVAGQICNLLETK